MSNEILEDIDNKNINKLLDDLQDKVIKAIDTLRETPECFKDSYFMSMLEESIKLFDAIGAIIDEEKKQ